MMPITPAVLAHLCGEQEWAQARIRGGIRVEPSDSSDGAPFIHLSTLEQVHLPANRLFCGRTDLVLLHIDAAALDSPVRWEPGVPTDPESMLFPHLYGPLPASAVIRVTAYRAGARWHLPAGRRISGFDVGVSFDLHQQFRCNERGNFDHGGRGTCFTENFSVHFSDLAPPRNIGHVDAGTDHVGKCRARLPESNFDAAQSVSGLGGYVAGRSRAGRSGHRHVWADPYRARVTDHRFEVGSGRDDGAAGRHAVTVRPLISRV